MSEPFTGAPVEAYRKIESLRAELLRKESAIESLRAEVEALKIHEQATYNHLTEARQEIARLNEENERLRHRLWMTGDDIGDPESPVANYLEESDGL